MMDKKIEEIVGYFGGIAETCEAWGIARMTLHRYRNGSRVSDESKKILESKYPQFDGFWWMGSGHVAGLPASLVSELRSNGIDVTKPVTFRITEGNNAEFKQS